MGNFRSFESQKRGLSTASPSSFARPVRSFAPVSAPFLQPPSLDRKAQFEHTYHFGHSLDRIAIFPPEHDAPTRSEEGQQKRSVQDAPQASMASTSVQPAQEEKRSPLRWNIADIPLFPDPTTLPSAKSGMGQRASIQVMEPHSDVSPPAFYRFVTQVVQRREREKTRTQSALPKKNTTGLPDTLKAGVEKLSGLSMDDVQVHYHSSKPAEVQALAYTQGTEIHVGPGQEEHLAHEAWHVVQQKQGRVEPTVQTKNTTINDDIFLEQEADFMGVRALEWQSSQEPTIAKKPGPIGTQPVQLMSLYHGTTIEDANAIVDKVDPSKGSGEFGMGFYTVFAEAQALHIAMYYWDKEGKYRKNNTGVAVVQIDIPNELWESLIQKKGTSVYYDPNVPVNETDPPEKTSTPPSIWLPTNGKNMDKKYFATDKDAKSEDRNIGIIVGPIKDPKTPYLQVVFGKKMAEMLNKKEVLKKITKSYKNKSVWGEDKYNPVMNKGIERRGSLVYTSSMKSKDFAENAAGKKSVEERQSYVQTLFGGLNDAHIPDEVAEFLRSKRIKGEKKGDVIFLYITNGLSLDTSDQKSEV